jgi:tetratricopeptide (TPR) repeat protein
MGADAEMSATEPDPAQHFSLREAARILEVPEARLRALARAGLLNPQHGPIGPLSFAFQDLLLLRTTKGLLESGVPMRQVRRIWVSLREQLSAELPLTSISIHTDGERVVASDGRVRWRPESGQMLLDFEASELVERAGETADPGRPRVLALLGAEPPFEAAPPDERGAGPAPGEFAIEGRRSADASEAAPTAEDWYQTGCELEASRPDRAREAYQHALDLDAGLPDAHVNVGRLLHLGGEPGRAEFHYREAVRLAPDDPTPHFNLGVLLEEAGRKDEAVLAYRQAILRDPEFADAHCNLGLLLESLGRRQEAVRHLMAARRLDDPAE